MTLLLLATILLGAGGILLVLASAVEHARDWSTNVDTAPLWFIVVSYIGLYSLAAGALLMNYLWFRIFIRYAI